MLTFKQAVLTCVKEKPLNIRDRAPRSEYWWFMLALFLCGLVVSVLSFIPVLGWLLAVAFNIGSFVLSITVGVRRLHDINRTGLWLLAPYGLGLLALIFMILGFALGEFALTLAFLLAALSSISVIALIIFTILPGTKGPNRFGPDPLEGTYGPVAGAFESVMAQSEQPSFGEQNAQNNQNQQ